MNRSLENTAAEIMLRKHLKNTVTVSEEDISEEVETLEEAKSKYHVSVNYTKGYGTNAEHAVKHYTTPRPNVPDQHISSILTSHVREHIPQHKEMIKKGWRTSDLGMVGSHEAKYAKAEAEERHAQNVANTNSMKKMYKESTIPTGETEEQKSIDGSEKKRKSLHRLMQIQRQIIDEEEQIDEISNKVLGSYFDKAVEDNKSEKNRYKRSEGLYKAEYKLAFGKYGRFSKDSPPKGTYKEAVEKDQQRLDTVKKIKTGNKNNQIVINPPLEKPDANTITTTSS